MRISVPIRPDLDGYTGRECPTCERYFKIKGGTGIPGLTVTHCPYCNHVGPHTEFWTKQQIAFARSVAMNKVSSQLLSSMKKLERRPDPRALMSIGITVRGSPTPIRHYTEKELEERVTCSSCSLEYTIYGSFGYCPDCGMHNSEQIANANLDLVLRALDLAGTAMDDLRAKLVENALEDAVACFDGFGREHCANQPYKISFQNLEAARVKLQREHGLDLATSLSAADWSFVAVQFQKRHLLAHTLGIIDADFIAKTSASPSLEGRKVTITDSDVRKLVGHLRVLAEALHRGLPKS
jgi:ribosomal protein L44E